MEKKMIRVRFLVGLVLFLSLIAVTPAGAGPKASVPDQADTATGDQKQKNPKNIYRPTTEKLPKIKAF